MNNNFITISANFSKIDQILSKNGENVNKNEIPSIVDNNWNLDNSL